MRRLMTCGAWPRRSPMCHLLQHKPALGREQLAAPIQNPRHLRRWKDLVTENLSSCCNRGEKGGHRLTQGMADSPCWFCQKYFRSFI